MEGDKPSQDWMQISSWYQSFSDERHSVNYSPDDEIPCASMPQPSQNHGYEKVPVRFDVAASITSERNVEVVP